MEMLFSKFATPVKLDVLFTITGPPKEDVEGERTLIPPINEE